MSITIIRLETFTTLFSTILCANAVAAADVQLPFDASSMLRDGTPAYVSDEIVASQVSWLKNAGPRLDTCFQSRTIPQLLYITYKPRKLTQHTGAANLLTCTHERGSTHVVCETNSSHPVTYFDTDPAQNFSLDGIGLDEAMPLIRAVLRNQVKFADGIPDPELHWRKGTVGTITRKADGFEILYGDCGCTGLMHVVKNAGGEFVATRAGFAICI